MERLTPEAALKMMRGWNDDEMKQFGLLLEEAAVETKNAADPAIKLRAHIFRPLSDYLEDLAYDDSVDPDLDDYVPGLRTFVKERFPGRGPQKSLESRNKLIFKFYKQFGRRWTIILEALKHHAAKHNMPELLVNRDGNPLNARAIRAICEKHTDSEHI